MSGGAKASLLFSLLFLPGLCARAQTRSTPLIDEGQIKPPKRLPSAFEQAASTRTAQPWPIRLMIRPIERGMFVRLPIMNTDPNRGITFGVMPIWVIKGKDEDRIRHIHAPSLTYNDLFKFVPTYRYYYYPTSLSSLVLRASISKTGEREALTEYEDLDFLGRGIAANGKLQLNTDRSERFFGVGPASSVGDETNYTRKTLQYFFKLGLPIFTDSGWRFNIGHHLAGENISDGLIQSLPNIPARFPNFAPIHTHQDSELHLFIDYDARDNPMTPTAGSYVKLAMENSQRPWGSEFAFARYTIDMRHYLKIEGVPPTTAARLRFEQLEGNAPFYLLPQLGGKYTDRAYGRGRYVDQGMMTAGVEERFVVYEIKLAGVSTELELSPFFDLGTVFDTPGDMTSKYFRPAVGGAVRAIAKPQVVGSIDFGVGQEGVKVFMDINYSF